MATINLEDYRTVDQARKICSKVFTGRERGETVRKASKIDDYVQKKEIVHIKVPEDIFSINPSFLEEFLSTAVKTYGKADILQYVIFDPPFRFQRQLEEAIDRISRSSTALD